VLRNIGWQYRLEWLRGFDSLSLTGQQGRPLRMKLPTLGYSAPVAEIPAFQRRTRKKEQNLLGLFLRVTDDTKRASIGPFGINNR
jgi:hypothetical protein